MIRARQLKALQELNKRCLTTSQVGALIHPDTKASRRNQTAMAYRVLRVLESFNLVNARALRCTNELLWEITPAGRREAKICPD